MQNGYKANKPADPERSGFDFTGWYTDEACTAEYSFDTPVTAPLTLYAGWEPTFIPVERIEITPAKKAIYAGNPYGFEAKVYPENATNPDVEWVIWSGNAHKATVTADPNYQYSATVQTLLRGRINVTVKSQDGSGVYKKALVVIKSK